jgi:hypothetical protein
LKTSLMMSQLICLPHNLRICFHSVGAVGACFDGTAFAATDIAKYPSVFYDDNEGALADSAYQPGKHWLPLHKEPAASIRANSCFNTFMARLRVFAEMAIGALKGASGGSRLMGVLKSRQAAVRRSGASG